MGMKRRPAPTEAKLERLRKTLHHQEPDRVPNSDFFWGGFLSRWRRELDLPPDADPYYYYDLDWIVTIPNMDPHIEPFETVQESQNEVWVKTGFETALRKRLDLPMPEQMSWDTDSIEKLETFEFDDPCDHRRFFAVGEFYLACCKAAIKAATGRLDGFVIWGNVTAIFEDYIEMGVDAYNPLEVKAGMNGANERRG